MKKIQYPLILLFFLVTITSYAQDPSFSQFFSSPLNINPALTANINEDWRAISNLRDQWIGPASPYTTGTISYDSKIMEKRIPNVAENNIVGLGGMLMYDQAMGGVAKSTYGSLNLSYNIKLSEDYYGRTQRLGLGFGAIYGRRYVDFSKLDFEDQFTGHGFNTSLPTGEMALSNMKAYISSSAGIVYTYKTDNSNLDMGVAAFHLNKPKQTFLEDKNQYLAMRTVAHANFEKVINDRVVLNTNGIYQAQSKASYFSLGAALGYYLEPEDGTMITGGLWYWSKNAVIPYLALTYKTMQVGVSYDVTISKLAQAATKPTTWELSIIFRGTKRSTGIIPCPWK